jgi:hypothetical protein
MTDKPEKQIKKRRAPKSAWQPGQSGNPAGRPKDQEYRDAIAMLKGKSPELMKKAIDMAMDGSEKVMVAILSKICPDKLDVGIGLRGIFFVGWNASETSNP